MTRDSRWNHQWFLVHRAEKTAYTCYSRTEEFKKNWMKAITDALYVIGSTPTIMVFKFNSSDNIEPPGYRSNHHKFKMHTYDRPTVCSHCSKFLKGKIYQGYQCERCHVDCHKMCLAYCGRCGTNQPPLLPPRLPSRSVTPVQHPTVAPALLQELQTLVNFFKKKIALIFIFRYLWFVGEMGRETAASVLENRSNGTFLLRVRPMGPMTANESFFALSIK